MSWLEQAVPYPAPELLCPLLKRSAWSTISTPTVSLQAGIHPLMVSERLGHSTVGITLDTYSHVVPALEEEAATRFEDALREPVSAPVG